MDVNWISILLGAIASMVIGSIWYGPLFGKQWMKLVGLTDKDVNEAKKKMAQTYSQMFVASVVTVYVLAVTIGMASEKSLMTGLTAAFWLWLGFVAAVKYSDVLFNKKPWNLYFIEIGYFLVFMLVAGGIIGSI